MKDNLVSVILPVFNGELYIDQAINSILQQSHQRLELLIINDGSTDNTAKVINTFYDNRIRSFHQKNSGPSNARNRGIREAIGNYISLIDADDIYLPNKLAEQISCLDQTEADACYCDHQLIDENSQKGGIVKSEGVYQDSQDFLAMLLFRQILLPPTIMFRKSCFEKGLRYDESYKQAEDYKFTLDLAQNNKINYLSKVLYLYRRHRGNLSNDHLMHEENEKKIIKEIGTKNIVKMVDNTTFNIIEKKLLKAKIFYKIDEFKDATCELNTIFPPTDSSLFYSGNIHFFKNNYNDAIRLYLKAITINSYRAEIHNNLGCCLAKIKNKDKAYICFKKAMDLKKNYKDPKENIRELSNECENFKLTRRELRTELAIYHSNS